MTNRRRLLLLTAYLVGSISLCWLLGQCADVLSAPAPKPRPAPPAKQSRPDGFVGSWRMTWGNGQGDVVFTRDQPGGTTGGYWCLWCGEPWVGGWKLEGRKLTVTEGRVGNQPDGVPHDPMTWTVDLAPDGRSGQCTCQSSTFEFRLDRE